MTEEAKKAKYVKFVLRQMIATIEEAEAETVGDAIILVQRRCDALAEELSNGNSLVAQ